jgi:hypothetical protein
MNSHRRFVIVTAFIDLIPQTAHFAVKYVDTFEEMI